MRPGPRRDRRGGRGPTTWSPSGRDPQRRPAPGRPALSRPGALLIAVLLAGCGSAAREVPDSAESVLGERLFRETRFAEFFASRTIGRSVNEPLAVADPVVQVSAKADGAPLPGPYAGLSMNCAACHLVDEQVGVAGGGIRTYADFARRSPIPAREDGATVTPRNAPRSSAPRSRARSRRSSTSTASSRRSRTSSGAR